MNFSLPVKSGPIFVPFRSRKSLASEGYSSACVPFDVPPGSRVAPPVKRFNDVATRRTEAKAKANKWYKEPKIPVHMNSSTLIRMNSKNHSGVDSVLRDDVAGAQLTRTAMSFLKRDRRMSDLDGLKGCSPFDDSSYVKKVFLDIVSNCDPSKAVAASSASVSANPAGDGAYVNGTYHRAFSVDDYRFGCNLKYVEQISFESKRNSNPPGVRIAERDARDKGTAASKITKITKQLRNFDLHENNATARTDTGTADVAAKREWGDAGERAHVVVGPATKSKKRIKKRKKFVVVTCLKNSSVKCVRRTGTRDGGRS